MSALRRYMMLAVLPLLGIVAGCAFTPAKLALKPNVPITSSDIGRGTRVAFKFVDERDDVTIGHRSVATVGAKISAPELSSLTAAELRRGLTAKQFQLVGEEAPADAEVIYRLRAFKFDIEQGFWTGGRNASAALAVDARRGNRSYTKVYRYNSEKRIVFVPGESEINQQMNQALGEILTKAVNDAALDRFLAGQ